MTGPSPPPTAARLVSAVRTTKGVELKFAYTTPEFIGHLIGGFFVAHGYKHEGDGLSGSVFGKGSVAARLLAGGFATREKFGLIVSSEGPLVSASVTSLMSGVYGGAIGIVREKSARERFASELFAYVYSCGVVPLQYVVPPPSAPLSPDGHYWWDGAAWQPVTPPAG